MKEKLNRKFKYPYGKQIFGYEYLGNLVDIELHDFLMVKNCTFSHIMLGSLITCEMPTMLLQDVRIILRMTLLFCIIKLDISAKPPDNPYIIPIPWNIPLRGWTKVNTNSAARGASGHAGRKFSE